ncbi:glycosyltransferase family 2 protein [Nocardioides sp. SOB77]|uniref:Glycosyltransferase family 2 protein n=1 Tax=Nocardioides oceani TaxID=3058369 RepID=A0ABT8FJ34_9ACTN|nr:glycosyltransferase family 2 protein [Nocardioides oceani]MDN4174515.1 glycosyltransferase family 2 protein [Nocardioides oceani]
MSARACPRRRQLLDDPAEARTSARKAENLTQSALPITVLVQTKNEAAGIEKCLRALGGAFDEVIVVDSESTDGTQAIATGLGVRVENFSWNGAYPKKKQWQLDNLVTRNQFILFLDADETPTKELIDELRHLVVTGRLGSCGAYDIELDYRFSGRFLRHGHRVTKRCLVDRTVASFPEIDDLRSGGMGELEGHYQPISRGRIGTLSGRIRHDDVDPVATWFDRHNRYSEWEAYLRVDPALRRKVRGHRSRQGQLFDAMPGKPILFFCYSFFFRLGFLDGRAGLDYAIALASYYWQIDLKVRELTRIDRRTHP